MWENVPLGLGRIFVKKEGFELKESQLPRFNCTIFEIKFLKKGINDCPVTSDHGH